MGRRNLENGGKEDESVWRTLFNKIGNILSYIIPLEYRKTIAENARVNGATTNNGISDYTLQLNDDPGVSFLLTDKEQEEFMKSLGYFKTNDKDGIKKINKATKALSNFRGNDNINIYQIGENVIPRDSIIPIDRKDIPSNLVKSYKYSLKHAGQYPTIYYKHINPNKKEYYYKDIDLNDYGNHNNSAGAKYNVKQIFAELYDLIGNPFIQKTGIQPMVEKESFEGFKKNHFK